MPEVWRARSISVIGRVAGTVFSGLPSTATRRSPSCGKKRVIGSPMERRPSSSSVSSVTPVSGLVMLAMGKMASTGIGRVRAPSRLPKAS
jgi:hypothetical protein